MMHVVSLAAIGQQKVQIWLIELDLWFHCSSPFAGLVAPGTLFSWLAR
jgi:hypothetical protein